MRARSDPLTENSVLVLVRPGRVRLRGGRRVKSVDRVQQCLACTSMLTLSPLSPAASVQLWRSRLGRVLYSMANCLLLMKVGGQLSCTVHLALEDSVIRKLQGKSVLPQA